MKTSKDIKIEKFYRVEADDSIMKLLRKRSGVSYRIVHFAKQGRVFYQEIPEEKSTIHRFKSCTIEQFMAKAVREATQEELSQFSLNKRIEGKLESFINDVSKHSSSGRTYDELMLFLMHF